MPNVLKLIDTETDTEIEADQTLVPKETRHLIHSLSSDEVDKLKKIELLERQIDALFVVSKRLDSREHANHSLLDQLKEKIITLTEKQNLESEQFSSQYESLKQEIIEFSDLMKAEINQLRDDFKQEHKDSNNQFNRKLEDIQESQQSSEQLQAKKLQGVKNDLSGVKFVQNEHAKQLTELQGITQKLTSISDKLTDTLAQHELQIGNLEKNATEQQNSINELFDQTYDLNRTNEKQNQKQEAFESELQTLNEQQHNLELHTSQLEETHNALQQDFLTREQLVDKRYKMTNWLGAIALLAIGSLGTTFYYQQSERYDHQQALNINQQDSLAALSQQSAESSIKQSQISQQINDLESQLVVLKESLKNNKINTDEFQKRQEVIGIQLNQLANLVDKNNANLTKQLQKTIDSDKFYKKLQFIRADNQPVFDQSWIDVQKSARYTIQLVSSTSIDDIYRFIKLNHLEGDVAFRVSRLYETTWYSVVNGIYDNKAQAIAAANKLSDPIKANKPWVRSFGQLKIIN